MRRNALRRMVTALASVVIAAPLPCVAQDIDARTMAMIYDAVNGKLPAGADPAALAAARKALEEEKLVTPSRVATPEPDIVESYARALLLGTRAPQFLPELGEVRNAAMRRDRPATASAIGRLFAKAGRNQPDAVQMARYVDAVMGAGAHEGPPETVRRRIERPGRTIEITDARRAGLFTIEVTETPAGGGPARRTVVAAEGKVRPNAAGSGLEQRAQTVHACTATAEDANERRAALNGRWRTAASGSWEISGSGGSIVLTQERDDGYRMAYTGTYTLGRIQASHLISHPDDLEGGELPDWVRAGVVGRAAFVVRLDDCGDGALRGTWESRHVTYSPTYRTIDRIHDPYDLALNLSRGELEMARGGRFPEEGP